MRDEAIRLQQLGGRVRVLRLLRDEGQLELARRAGVGLKALRRLEQHGAATLKTALRVAWALRADDAFALLFGAPVVRHLEDLDAQDAVKTRQRASRTPRK